MSDIDNLRKGDWFVIEFHIQNSDKMSNHFMGNVSVEPKSRVSCRRTCKAEMGIDEVFQRKVMCYKSISLIMQAGNAGQTLLAMHLLRM